MTPREALIELQAAQANESYAADQLRTVLDHVAKALQGDNLSTRDKLDLGKLSLDLHARFRERAKDSESKACVAERLARDALRPVPSPAT